MFILTNIDARQDLVQIFDTSDGSNDVIRLSAVASQICNRGLKVHGIGRAGANKRQNVNVIPQLGVYVDVIEAKEAFAQYYQKHGMPRQMARARAGLSA